MKNIIGLTLWLVLTASVFAQTPISVAGVPTQPPLTFADGSGLAQDLMAALNTVQTKYLFTLKDVPAIRLKGYLGDGSVQLAIFNNLTWGFDTALVDQGPNLLDSGDRYCALASSVKDQADFVGVGKSDTIGVLGFSYKFAGFETNETKMKDSFHTTGVSDEAQVIKMVLAGRGKFGVVSSTALDYLKKTDPASFTKLTVSKGYDSQYSRSFLVSKKSPVSAKELEGFLKTLAASGKLGALYAKYGLTPPNY